MVYKFFCFTIFFFMFGFTGFSQSGRVKEQKKTNADEPPKAVFHSKENSGENKNQTNVSDEEEIIKVDSILIPLPVSVIDSVGRSVTDLRLEDFELKVDGQKAEISEIFRAETPVRMAVLFDNSSSVIEAKDFERRAAVQFLRKVIRPEKDQAALFSVSSAVRLEQTLTPNIAQLIRSIESFPEPEGATALLDGIVKASNYLRDVQGRRVIVIVSDGQDTLSDATLDETIRSAQLANCQIYIVKTTDFENFKKTGSRGGNANIRALSAERRMQQIARQTGGTVYAPLDEAELEKAFNRISTELSEQYILNYYPSDDAAAIRRYHTIELNVKNSNRYLVRTRQGYYIGKQ